MQLLKENLVGQELDGKPWAPGNKTKDILIADYRCGQLSPVTACSGCRRSEPSPAVLQPQVSKAADAELVLNLYLQPMHCALLCFVACLQAGAAAVGAG